jgi:hypothetical protein
MANTCLTIMWWLLGDDNVAVDISGVDWDAPEENAW